MQLFLFGLLPLISTTAASSNLRRAADLIIDVGSKNVLREANAHDSVAEVTIELTNHKGIEYVGPISLGGQSLMAIYDTGSFDVMAVSDHCSSCRVPAKMKVYHNKSSKTFKKGKSSETFEHWFAGGSITARLDYETVAMGTKGTIVKADGTAIWQVTDTTLPQWTREELCKFTTIVGLGFGAVAPDSPAGIAPVVQLLERAGTKSFAICLQKGKSNPGYVTLNPRYDFTSAGFTSMFRHLPVVGHKHWAVEHNGVSYFNGHYTDRRCDGPGECVAIIDSGTSLIGVPGLHMMFISEFASHIAPDCSNLDKLPDLNFDLGGHRFPLPASAYVLQLDGKCYAAFQQLTLDTDHGLAWVLGLPFLRHYFTLWDRQGPGLYIAEQGDNCKPGMANNMSVELAKTNGTFRAHIEPTIGDITQARLPSWAPHGSEKVTV